MTRLGDVNRFGVDIEVGDACRLRFWVEGAPLGDWERVVSLRDVMTQLSRIRRDAGRRRRFVDVHPLRVLERISGAGSERWEREHHLDVGEVDHVFALLLTELEALHAQELARKRGLCVDLRTVRVRSTGPATGVIAITLNGEPFPADGWSDFVVLVYAAWTNAIARLLRGSTTSERVCFMDGPYELRLTRVDAETIAVNEVEAFSARELAENAAMFAHELHEVCREQQYQSAYSPGDVLGLQAGLHFLNSVIGDARR